jgi:hypothetical protein
LQHNLYISVAKLVRFCQWTAAVLFGLSALVAHVDSFYFEPVGRTLIIIFALLPPALFIVGLYFYESQNYRTHESWQQAFTSLAVFVVLASPAISLNWRYTAFPFKAFLETALLVVGFILFLSSAIRLESKPSHESALITVLLHYRRVMRDSWQLSPLMSTGNEILSVASIERIKTERSPFYSQKTEDLLIFQQSLTCPELDAACTAAKLTPLFKKKQKITVVDIGGGDGLFTANLLRGLQDRQLSLLLNIDPAPRIHDVYIAAIEKIAKLQRSQIKCDSHGVEDNIPPKCDLIIASHSLYATFDKARISGGDVEGEVRRLLTQVNQGGCMVFILSSTYSIAISTKRKIYHKIFGSHNFDTVAEDIDPIVTKQGWVQQKFHNDSLIVLTELLGSYVNTGKASGEFIKWASYFLRCDLSQMPQYHINAIADVFFNASFKLRQLPEPVQQAALEVKSFGLHLDSLVLPHKSTIYILKPISG